MRFASRENTRLGQPEVGVVSHPGGGGAERLPHLVGRGRALEIVLGANDVYGDTAERYGYVNRSLPDTELDGFVEALARRIASFDRRAIAAAKNLVNQVSLPSADGLLYALNSFQTTLTWSEAQQRLQALLERGLNGTATSRSSGTRSSARSSTGSGEPPSERDNVAPDGLDRPLGYFVFVVNEECPYAQRGWP
jgi:enoyl-CoA hydratase/carnithine racemase